MIHYTHDYIINPPHKVTVDLIGLGGTGSQVLTGLARINEALVATGHPGLFVRAWDNDSVSEANVGRQLFSQSDIGQNKALVLITRINRYFGYDWQARPEKFKKGFSSNIIITCVDSAAARIEIGSMLNSIKAKDPTDSAYYWLDLGNLQKTGQAIIGTLKQIKQPEHLTNTVSEMKTVTKMFPKLAKIKEELQGPSCSLAEALEKQDLFINSTLAQFGCNLIWKLIRERSLTYHGCYVNLESMNVNPIKIQ